MRGGRTVWDRRQWTSGGDRARTNQPAYRAGDRIAVTMLVRNVATETGVIDTLSFDALHVIEPAGEGASLDFRGFTGLPGANRIDSTGA